MTGDTETVIKLMPQYPPPYSRDEIERVFKPEESPTDITENDNELPEVRTSKGSNCSFKTYCIFSVLAILVCTFFTSSIFPYPMHASCTVKWKFSAPCNCIMQRFRAQILKWSTCNDFGPRGSRCLYYLQNPEPNEDGVIRATHVTPNLKLTDKIKIVFEDAPQKTCVATGESRSSDWFVVFDYGSNYCNLRNLIIGAGFDKDLGFMELTSSVICTQLNIATCA
ncbi:uncharacterized protein LOC107263550 [Cephus cinctus]|uniref:Uncharacterized protein LOC107263550 n=1 Tax=Cephus cinctus TaxID=211228 RepID=A0AAJ7BHP9_CEPCN|nr:uncharacterized protein LOC107263550 [Cephus cinctus]